MRKFALPTLLLSLLCLSCTRNSYDSATQEQKDYTASIEQSETKVYIDGNLNTRWNEDDRISIFRSTYNAQYRFNGNTGDRSGTFTETGIPGKGDAVPTVYAFYPYRDSTFISTSGELTFKLPPVQTYSDNSFGQGANSMVAVTETPTSHDLRFKNLCGFLVFNFYGEGVVKSISFTGNNGEKIAGTATVSPVYGKNPIVEVSFTGTESITLDCGKGVKLGQTAETATPFWMVIPPVSLGKGFSITITDTAGKTMTKSVTIPRTVERNVKNSMETLQVKFETKPEEDIFHIDTTSFEVDAKGGEISFTVTSNIGYEITNKASGWIKEVSVSEENGITSKKYKYAVSENKETKTRTGIIVVCNDHSICIPVTVKQKAGEEPEEKIYVSQTDFFLGAEASDFSFTVGSKSDYSVQTQTTWIKEKSADNTSGYFVYSAEANTDNETREGTILIFNDKDTCKVTVYQSGIGEPEEKEWSKKEFAHRSLAMKQTATWCGYCPRMSRALEEAYAKAPGEFEILNVYVDGSDYAFDQEEILQNAYSIRGAPVGTIDGRREVSNSEPTSVVADSIIAYSRETVSLYGTTTGISFNSTLNGDKMSLQITAYIKEAGAYKITAVLTESGIIGPQDDYDEFSHLDYVHNNVARIGFTSILGDDFTTSKDAEERKFTYSATIPSDYVRENLKIIVYIHRSFGDQQRVSDYYPYGFFNYYVDNLAIGKVGETVPLAFKSGGSGGNEGIGDGGEIEW